MLLQIDCNSFKEVEVEVAEDNDSTNVKKISTGSALVKVPSSLSSSSPLFVVVTTTIMFTLPRYSYVISTSIFPRSFLALLHEDGDFLRLPGILQWC